MKIWLLTVGEPLIVDGKNERMHRTGVLAQKLVERGHKVVWWSSSFDHVRKKQRVDKTTGITLEQGYQLVLLHSVPYGRNVSIDRIRNHYGVASEFNRLSKNEELPDLIVTSYPTLELSVAAVKLGTKHKIPVVVDIRDLWPDIFLELMPNVTKLFGRILLYPMFKNSRKALQGATAIIGITPEIVKWGLSRAQREPTWMDRSFYLGYHEETPSDFDVAETDLYWTEKGITKDTFNLCFFGAIGRQFDFDTLLEAARKFEKTGDHRFRFIFCGSGDYLENLRLKAQGLKNVVVPGWVGRSYIWSLMRRSSVGVAPYVGSWDFQLSVPNKIAEYLSAGLPVLSSLPGATERLLSENHCGLFHKTGDVETLMSQIRNLCDNPGTLQEMSVRGHHLFQEELNADKLFSDHIEHLEKIAVNGGGDFS